MYRKKRTKKNRPKTVTFVTFSKSKIITVYPASRKKNNRKEGKMLSFLSPFGLQKD